GRALRPQPVQRDPAHPAARGGARRRRGTNPARVDRGRHPRARPRAGPLPLHAAVLAPRRLDAPARRAPLPAPARGLLLRRRTPARAHAARAQGRPPGTPARHGRESERHLRPLRAPGPAPADFEKAVSEWFEVMPLPGGTRRAAGEIDCVVGGHRYRLRVGAGAAGALRHFPPVVRTLDVAILHELILERVLGLHAEDLAFTHDDDEAVAEVELGRASAAFLLNPPTMAQVREVCLAGELMPEKSTYFYPKLATGLVFSLVGPPWV